jgi:integrase
MDARPDLPKNEPEPVARLTDVASDIAEDTGAPGRRRQVHDALLRLARLLGRQAAAEALKVSQLTAKGAIYERLVRVTRARFGHALTPHLFRDCAATSIALADPEHVYITRSIVGHTTLETSERYYNHAQSREAMRI